MIRTEIGSEFYDIPLLDADNLAFDENIQWFISGRSALKAIIAENNFDSVSIPDWCCESIVVPFLRSGVSVSFYNPFNPPDSFTTDAVIAMDFFGFSSNIYFNKANNVIIRDLTHSVFTKKYNDANYYFGSLRKWAGFFTGGFAWGFKKNVDYTDDSSSYIQLRQIGMQEKLSYISCRTDSKDFLHTFSDAEDLLEDIGISPSCERDIISAKRLDIDYIKQTRRNNARILLDAFSDIAVFDSLGSDDCPLFVPICVKNRDGLRSWLIKNGIYCPVHWPVSIHHNLSKKTQSILDNEISLVCDQRYNDKDMRRIIDTIKSFSGR